MTTAIASTEGVSTEDGPKGAREGLTDAALAFRIARVGVQLREVSSTVDLLLTEVDGERSGQCVQLLDEVSRAMHFALVTLAECTEHVMSRGAPC